MCFCYQFSLCVFARLFFRGQHPPKSTFFVSYIEICAQCKGTWILSQAVCEHGDCCYRVLNITALKCIHIRDGLVQNDDTSTLNLSFWQINWHQRDSKKFGISGHSENVSPSHSLYTFSNVSLFSCVYKKNYFPITHLKCWNRP